MRVSIALPVGISAGDTLRVALADGTSLTSISLSALQVASGAAIVTLPTLSHADLATANGYAFGIKARVEAPNGTVTGTTATLLSGWSGVLNIVLDTVAPTQPLWDKVDSRSTVDINGFVSFYSKTSRPQLQGTAEPGSVIRVVANDVFLGTTTVLNDGTWQFDTNGCNLADGSYSVVLTATDLAGNITAESEPQNLTIDTKVPESPKITGVRLDTGRSSTDAVTQTRTVVLDGRAEPYSRVRIYRDGVAGALGTVTTDRNGLWNFSYTNSGVPVSLGDNTYTFSAVALDVVDNESKPSLPFALVVDNVAPPVPVITGVTPDTGISASDALTRLNTIELQGTAQANALISIYLDGTASAAWIGSVVADDFGHWQLDLSALAIAAGQHTVYAKAADLAGNTSGMTTAFNLTIDQTAPCLLYTSPSPRDVEESRMPSSA